MKKLTALFLVLVLSFSCLWALAEDSYTVDFDYWNTKMTENEAVALSDALALYYDIPQDEEHFNVVDLMDLGICYMFADTLDFTGFTLQDLDGNGKPELIVATTDTDNEFFQKMVLDVYSLTDDEYCHQVLSSGERDRYYYLGGDLFANEGSNGADDSICTTLQYKDGQLIDLGTPADPSAYVQLQLEKIVIPEE